MIADLHAHNAKPGTYAVRLLDESEFVAYRPDGRLLSRGIVGIPLQVDGVTFTVREGREEFRGGEELAFHVD